MSCRRKPRITGRRTMAVQWAGPNLGRSVPMSRRHRLGRLQEKLPAPTAQCPFTVLHPIPLLANGSLARTSWGRWRRPEGGAIGPPPYVSCRAICKPACVYCTLVHRAIQRRRRPVRIHHGAHPILETPLGLHLLTRTTTFCLYVQGSL